MFLLPLFLYGIDLLQHIAQMCRQPFIKAGPMPRRKEGPPGPSVFYARSQGQSKLLWPELPPPILRTRWVWIQATAAPSRGMWNTTIPMTASPGNIGSAWSTRIAPGLDQDLPVFHQCIYHPVGDSCPRLIRGVIGDNVTGLKLLCRDCMTMTDPLCSTPAPCCQTAHCRPENPKRSCGVLVQGKHQAAPSRQ